MFKIKGASYFLRLHLFYFPGEYLLSKYFTNGKLNYTKHLPSPKVISNCKFYSFKGYLVSNFVFRIVQ